MSRFYFLFVFVLMFGSITTLKANHAVGAELTYECLGGNQYRLRYAFYRDCASTVAPSSVNVNYSSSCFGSFNINLVPVVGTPSQIPIVCSSMQSTCNGGSYKGVEEWIYSGTATLAGACSDWIFSIALCCRNNAITTVSNPTNYQLYVFALLNNSDGLCNNSPTFKNKPFFFACIGQSVCFDNGVSDIDGDSVRYQIITPLAAAGNAIIYDFPYSSTQPVSSSPPVSFNSTNGDICMVPTSAEVSPYGLLVSEYRNGVLIGQVERDIQIEVRACNNSSPNMTGVNGSPVATQNICPNVPHQFYILSADADVADQTFLSWNDGIGGAQFTSWGGQRDSASFNWTPTLADKFSNPHCFTASVKDDHCPYISMSSKTFCLYVLDSSDATCLINDVSVINKNPGVSIFHSDNKFRIEWKAEQLFTNAKLYDSSGRVVREINMNNKSSLLLDIDDLKGGIYLLCMDGKEHWCTRLLKQN